MNKVQFTESQIEDIEEALSIEDLRSLPRKKLTALLMMAKGLTQSDVGKVIDANERTVRSYCKEFRELGIASIVEDRQYRPSSALEPHYDTIKESFRKAAPSTSSEAATRMAAISGINVSPSHARTIMARLGFKCLKPGSVPGKSDPQMQMDFFEQSLRPKLEEAAAGLRKVYFVDASHFTRGPYLKRLWSIGRLWMRTSGGGGRLSVLGALDSCGENLEFVATDGKIDALTAACILYKLREKHPQGEITVVLDNARYQACSRYRFLAKALNIDLLFLPPYSPNLNLIERLWKWVKNQCLYNKYYDTIKKFQNAVIGCMKKLDEQIPPSLKTMVAPNFQLPIQTGNL